MDKRCSYTETLIHCLCIYDIVLSKFVKETQKRASTDNQQVIDWGSYG